MGLSSIGVFTMAILPKSKQCTLYHPSCAKPSLFMEDTLAQVKYFLIKISWGVGGGNGWEGYRVNHLAFEGFTLQ